jgi:molecular chaperone IbpA
MTVNDFSPLYRTLVGFDRINQLMEQSMRNEAQSGYPPFNIEQTGEDNFRIELAVAGFAEDELNIEFKENQLVVPGANRQWKKRAGSCIAASRSGILSANSASLIMSASMARSWSMAC